MSTLSHMSYGYPQLHYYNKPEFSTGRIKLYLCWPFRWGYVLTDVLLI